MLQPQAIRQAARRYQIAISARCIARSCPNAYKSNNIQLYSTNGGMNHIFEKESQRMLLDPSRFLSKSVTKVDDNGVAMILLNTRIASFECFKRLRNHADFIICADGGADQLYTAVTEHFPDLAYDVALKRYLPQYIHGDLDSITSKVRRTYEKLGVKITKDPDQYSTDFQKAVKRAFEIDPHVRDIILVGSLGGRVDQGLGLVHELLREHQRRVDTRIWFFSETSVSIVLERGRTALNTKIDTGMLRKHVGILPVYGPAVISTSGFEWDVQEWHTEMGVIVSTSNHIVRDVVEICTDREVLFTIELSKELS